MPVIQLLVEIDECRRILDDYKSTDEQIIRKIQYLESFCDNIIRTELNNNNANIDENR